MLHGQMVVPSNRLESLNQQWIRSTKNQVFWDCLGMTRTETIGCHGQRDALFPPRPQIRRVTPAVPTVQFPDFGTYSGLIHNYSARLLTFSEDRLRAFSRTPGLLCTQFPSGFLYGLSEDFFTISLLWESTTNAQRIPCLPSWSWAGWTGQVWLVLHQLINNSLG